MNTHIWVVEHDIQKLADCMIYESLQIVWYTYMKACRLYDIWKLADCMIYESLQMVWSIYESLQIEWYMKACRQYDIWKLASCMLYESLQVVWYMKACRQYDIWKLASCMLYESLQIVWYMKACRLYDIWKLTYCMIYESLQTVWYMKACRLYDIWKLSYCMIYESLQIVWYMKACKIYSGAMIFLSSRKKLELWDNPQRIPPPCTNNYLPWIISLDQDFPPSCTSLGHILQLCEVSTVSNLKEKPVQDIALLKLNINYLPSLDRDYLYVRPQVKYYNCAKYHQYQNISPSV